MNPNVEAIRDRLKRKPSDDSSSRRTKTKSDTVTEAERVKSELKLQLSRTAEKDKRRGNRWERFTFNQDAPLDEGTYLDASQTFFSHNSQLTREKHTDAAHEAAMFGASPLEADSESSERADVAAKHEVLSDQIIAMQKDSWKERARKLRVSKLSSDTL